MEREDLSQMVAGEIHRQQARHHQGPVLSILFYNQDCFFAFYYINYISNYRQCSDVIPLIFLLTRNKRSISICGKMKRSVLENLRVGGVKMTTQKLPKGGNFPCSIPCPQLSVISTLSFELTGWFLLKSNG